MNKNLLKISCFAFVLLFICLGCFYLNMRDENTTIDTTTVSSTTTTTTTTTKPTTTQPKIERDDVLPDTPTFECTMNSVGGIRVVWKSRYTGEKDIKYYTVYFHLYNSVEDEAYDEIYNKSEHSMKVVGPVSNGESLVVYSDPLIYCKSCAKIQIDKIKLEYFDGTTDEFWYGWYCGVGYDFY